MTARLRCEADDRPFDTPSRRMRPPPPRNNLHHTKKTCTQPTPAVHIIKLSNGGILQPSYNIWMWRISGLLIVQAMRQQNTSLQPHSLVNEALQYINDYRTTHITLNTLQESTQPSTICGTKAALTSLLRHASPQARFPTLIFLVQHTHGAMVLGRQYTIRRYRTRIRPIDVDSRMHASCSSTICILCVFQQMAIMTHVSVRTVYYEKHLKLSTRTHHHDSPTYGLSQFFCLRVKQKAQLLTTKSFHNSLSRHSPTTADRVAQLLRATNNHAIPHALHPVYSSHPPS